MKLKLTGRKLNSQFNVLCGHNESVGLCFALKGLAVVEATVSVSLVIMNKLENNALALYVIVLNFNCSGGIWNLYRHIVLLGIFCDKILLSVIKVFRESHSVGSGNSCFAVKIPAKEGVIRNRGHRQSVNCSILQGCHRRADGTARGIKINLSVITLELGVKSEVAVCTRLNNDKGSIRKILVLAPTDKGVLISGENRKQGVGFHVVAEGLGVTHTTERRVYRKIDSVVFKIPPCVVLVLGVVIKHRVKWVTGKGFCLVPSVELISVALGNIRRIIIAVVNLYKLGFVLCLDKLHRFVVTPNCVKG